MLIYALCVESFLFSSKGLLFISTKTQFVDQSYCQRNPNTLIPGVLCAFSKARAIFGFTVLILTVWMSVLNFYQNHQMHSSGERID